LFDSLVRENKVPGIVGAFGVGDLPTVFPAAGRISDDAGAAPAGPDSLYRVYSMTKPITAMAAMILIEEGRIGLDDPLSKYFPAFAKMRVLTSPATSLDSVPATSAITIRELLTHGWGCSPERSRRSRRTRRASCARRRSRSSPTASRRRR
jgi:CubicO group peptidase (beta-lactamase class C family)